MYSFHTVEVKILPEDNKKDILDKIYKAISRVDYKTFLRLTMTGKTAFAITINADALRNELHKKVFFADVFDNTSMDIDVDEFENDISLRSEFVRLTLNDDSLSELERGRIISCGWNALTGKEVLDE